MGSCSGRSVVGGLDLYHVLVKGERRGERGTNFSVAHLGL